jgi:alpha-ribazole phosphatase
MSARDWYWVRHGPTHAKAMIGWTDLPADLSDTAKLARLEGLLPAGGIVVSSDLSRAAATADAIQASRTRLPHIAALREMQFGAWEGLTHSEAEALDRDRIFAFWDQPGDTSPPNGESWNALRARVDAAVEALDASTPPGPIIAVVHFGVILTQLQRVLEIGAREVFAQKIDNLSLTQISGGQAVRINHIP